MFVLAVGCKVWYCENPCFARFARSSAYPRAEAYVPQTLLSPPHVPSLPPPIGPSSCMWWSSTA